MVTFLISALAILAIIGIGLYFWQKPRAQNSEYILPPPPPDARGLFADNVSAQELPGQLSAIDDAAQLIARARQGDRSALIDAHAVGDGNLYDRALDEFVRQADSEAKLLALMSYVSQHELPVNESLALAAIASWQESPDRNTTAKALHFAALSDKAEVYCEAIEAALEFWRAGKLPNVSATELKTLFDGEFWILSSRSRSSGAGFVLKQTLADARRELESHTGSPSVSAGNSPNEALPHGRASDTT
jgi:hypothetical protein